MDILRAIAAIRTPIGEAVWSFFSCFGEEIFFMAVLCIVFWCVNKNLSYIIGATFFFGGLLTQGLKITFQIPRPWVLDPNFQPVDGAMKTATGFSFPSGHTVSAGSLFFPAATKGRWWWLLALMPFAVAFSRMYLGVHTLLDVGVALGIAAVFTAAVYAVSRSRLWEKPLPMALGLFLFSAGVLIYAFCRSDVTYEMLSDCVKAAAAGMGFAVGWFIEKKWIRFDTKAVWWMQLIKVAVGVGGVLAIKSGLKLLGDLLVIDALRYFLLVLWVIAVWPWLFKKFVKK